MVASFKRDRFTWLGYFSLAYYAYLQATLGPLMPFLRRELDLSYTVGGLHFSAFALGMIVAGLTADHLARRFGRRELFWGGGAGMAVFTVLFLLGAHVFWTVAGVFMMAFCGSFLLVMIQATLSDHHGEKRAIPLTEANIAASVAATLAPLLVGNFERFNIGWRLALLAGVAGWGFLFWRFRHESIPVSLQSRRRIEASSRRLPTIFWIYWLVIFLSVSVEWSVIFWGADFLETDIGLSRINAATLMSVFFIATVIGRTTGSYLTRLFPILRLLTVAMGLATVGFILYWLIEDKVLSVVGLFITGLGVANLFPLTLSVASGVVVPPQSDTASSRVSLGAGAAILIAPQILGAIADQSSIRTAYGLVMGILVIALGVIIYANRLATNRQKRENVLQPLGDR